MKVVVVADGEVDGKTLRALVAAAERPLVICADGGARRARDLAVRPDLVIGDGDSLSGADVDALRADGIEVCIVAAEKDESDTQLCLQEAAARGASAIVVLGALGGARVDHALANVGLLAMPELAGTDVAIVHRDTVIRLVGSPDAGGSVEVDGAPGDLLSLLPLGDRVTGVTTHGLRYPLRDEPLPLGPARGLSNELVADRARVEVAGGRLLVVHTRTAAARPSREDDR